MAAIFASLSRFTMMMFVIYTLDSFLALRTTSSRSSQMRMFHRQQVLMYLILLNGNAVLFCNTLDVRILLMLAAEAMLFAIAMTIYKKMYKGASYALVNHMCMLLTIGFIMLTRLDIARAFRQLIFAAAALAITCFVPWLIEKLRMWKQLKWAYAIFGIGALGVVTVLGNRTFGANLSITIGSVTIQPSEFVKILFVFYIACMLYKLPEDDQHTLRIMWKSNDFKTVFITTVVVGIHALILVAARDLGSATIFLITYLAMLYVATRKPTYLFGGLGVFALAAVAGYAIFPHVQQRVAAWKDPIAVYNSEGYQVSQSLFGIGTGGWFGSGLGHGMPDSIPVVTKDFIFAAISEEMGGIFALCLILVCISYFLTFMQIAMQIRDQFYKLIALGLAVTYGIQVFLMIGGVIKFIPSTGVTLPLVSYGGSSLVSTMFIIAIIQGLYCRQASFDQAREELSARKNAQAFAASRTAGNAGNTESERRLHRR